MAITLFGYRKSLHRQYLECYLTDFLPKLEGPILEVGSKNRRYDHLLRERPTAVDLLADQVKDVQQGDIQNLSFPADSFAAVICLEVLEYVDEPKRAAQELARVLKKSGVLILSVPFMYKFHDDKMRYTSSYIQALLSSSFEHVECKNIGNFYSIILDIAREKIRQIGFVPVRYLFILLYYPFLLLLPLARNSKDVRYVSGYFVIARK